MGEAVGLGWKVERFHLMLCYAMLLVNAENAHLVC
jgi:hypothetical protein